jgi:hypothetical protein
VNPGKHGGDSTNFTPTGTVERLRRFYDAWNRLAKATYREDDELPVWTAEYDGLHRCIRNTISHRGGEPATDPDPIRAEQSRPSRSARPEPIRPTRADPPDPSRSDPIRARSAS